MALLPLFSVASSAAEQQLTFGFDSTSFSEPTSLRSLSGKWDDGVGDGDRALSVTRLLIGYRADGYSVEYVRRHDTYYRFANDTARLLYLVENRLPLEPGENYRLDIEPRRSASRGLRFGLALPARNDFRWWAYLSVLSPVELLDGRLRGDATASAANDYDFDFNSNLVYRHDPLYGRSSQELSGDGYALDLRLEYAFAERWRLQLELRDLAGRLAVDDAQRTVADATSSTKTFDDEGYLVYDPAVSGREDSVDRVIEFEPQLHAELRYRVSADWSVAVADHRYDRYDYREFSLLRGDAGSEAGLHLMPEAGALGLSYRSGDAAVLLAADDIEAREAAFFRVEVRLGVAF